MSEKIGIEQWLQRERSEWLSFIFVMNGVMLRLVLLLFYFALFKNLILIIGSPAFAFLSEKTEALLEGKQHHFNWEEVGVDAKRGIRLAIQNSGKELLNFAGLILLAIVPLVGWITPLIAILMQGYYFGVSMLDYSFARHKLTLEESVRFSSHHKGLAIGNGIIFYMLHMIPIIGWVFAPCYAVIAATLSLDPKKQID